MKGFEGALASHCDEIAVFAAASESFSRRNTNCSIAESYARIAPVADAARAHDIRVRGYISTVVDCPYEGPIAPQAQSPMRPPNYRELGCYEISLGDTIGTGTPRRIQSMIEAVAEKVPVAKLAGHYHDTYGQALANILASLELGVADLRQFGGRAGRLSLRAWRYRQCRERGCALHARRARHRDRSRSRQAGGGRAIHLGGAGPATAVESRAGARGEARS